MFPDYLKSVSRLLSPVELLVVGLAACAQVEALEFGVVCTRIVLHVKRNLRAVIIDSLAEFSNNSLVLGRVDGRLNGINQGVDLRNVGTSLVGRVDGAGVIYAQCISKKVAGGISADSCLVVTSSRYIEVCRSMDSS